MMGIFGIIAFLKVLALSMVITRIASVAITLTGVSSETARFQARSAFTGTGFTTSEAENVVDHPVRRRIIMILMIARSAGLVSILISLILSFANSGDNDIERLMRLGYLVGGVLVLWLISLSRTFGHQLERLIRWALKRWTSLEIRDYENLFNLSGDYGVKELKVKKGDWLAGKTLDDCNLIDEGILVLGIYREDGSYLGAPQGDTEICPRDNIFYYIFPKKASKDMHIEARLLKIPFSKLKQVLVYCQLYA